MNIFTALNVVVSLLIIQPKIVNAPLKGYTTKRDTTVNYVVLHYDSSSTFSNTKRYLRKKHNSYHYYVQRDGTVVKLVDPKYKANHVGVSFWDGKTKINNYSIGICLQNIYPQQYTEEQYRSLAWLIDTLQKRFPNIQVKNIIGHSDVARPVGRKVDPGNNFNWEILREYITINDIL